MITTVAAGCGVRAVARSPSASKPETLRQVRCERSRSTIPLCGSSADIEASCCLHQPGKESKIVRSEEHTSELQSLTNLVCRLLLEKKKNDGLAIRTAHPKLQRKEIN